MSLATAYAARMLLNGETLSAQGASAIDELEAINTAQSVTLLHGWLAGSKVNLSEGKILDLVGSVDFIHEGEEDSTLHVTEGMVTLESEVTGPLLDTDTHVFTNQDWSALLLVDKASRDMVAPSDETSISISQYEDFANGHFRLIQAFEESSTINWVGSSNSSIAIKGASPALRPAPAWLTYTHSTRTLVVYYPFTGVDDPYKGFVFGTSVGADLGGGNAWPASAKLRIGTQFVAPRLTTFGGLVMFDGVLSEAKRNALFDVYYDVMTRFADTVLIYGNSVTSGSDATQFDQSWAGLFHQEAVLNNAYVWSPSGMGGKGLYHYRPADYTVPAGREALLPLATRLADAYVENFADKRITHVIFDENQNTLAGVGTAGAIPVTYGDFKHVREAICAKLPQLQKKIQGTFIAPWAITYDTFEVMSYAQVAADVWRVSLRDCSIAVRIDADVDEVFDLFATFNLGWTAEHDGTAAIPATDLPNGNSAYFLDDPQHPSNAGHEVMFDGYWAAYQRIVNAQPVLLKLRRFACL